MSDLQATTVVAAAACPECGVNLDFERMPRRHEIVRCETAAGVTPTGCGAELEVIAIDPVTLELAPEVEEDWGE